MPPAFLITIIEVKMYSITRGQNVLVILIALLCSVQFAHAQVPKKLSYQGKIVDSSGNALADGSYNIRFALYSSETGGSPAWQETQGVTVNNGLFGVMLGENSSINLTFDKPYWLGVKFGTDAEMSPRSLLGASAASLHASSVSAGAIKTNSLADGSVTTSKLANGAITADKIAPNALPSLSLGDNSVGTRNLSNGAVTTAKLANGAITADKIAANALPTLSLGDGAVATRNIVDGAVTNAKLAPGAVAAGLGANSINTQHIANGAITADKIAANALPTLSLSDNSVQSRHIADGAITADKLDPNALPTPTLANLSVENQHLADRSVTSEKVAISGIYFQNLARNSVGTNTIMDEAVDASKIGPDAIKSRHINDEVIIESHIQPSPVEGQVLKTVNGKTKWSTNESPGHLRIKTQEISSSYIIDHPDLNNNPDAFIWVQHIRSTSSTVHGWNLSYHQNNRRWYIWSPSVMQAGEFFNLLYYKN